MLVSNEGWETLKKISQKSLQESKGLCKGLFYRARVNFFINKKGHVIHQERMVPLKRMSCKGCGECTFIKEDLSEYVANELSSKFSKVPINGEIYQLIITNEFTDWETGVVEDWDLMFVKVEE